MNGNWAALVGTTDSQNRAPNRPGALTRASPSRAFPLSWANTETTKQLPSSTADPVHTSSVDDHRGDGSMLSFLLEERPEDPSLQAPYETYEVEASGWRQSSAMPEQSSTESTSASAVSRFSASPFDPAWRHLHLPAPALLPYQRTSQAIQPTAQEPPFLNTTTSSPSTSPTTSSSTSFSPELPPYFHLPRLSLPSFESPLLATPTLGPGSSMVAPPPHAPSTTALGSCLLPVLSLPPMATAPDPFQRSWSSSLHDVLRPSFLEAASSSGQADVSTTAPPPPVAGPLPAMAHQAPASPASRDWSPMWRQSSPSSSSSFSSPDLSSSLYSRPQPPKRKRSASVPSAPSSTTSRKPILRRKMEEEYYHYLKEKLSRMESTRIKREQGLLRHPSSGSSSSSFSSPESSEVFSPTSLSCEDFRREEEQLYLSGTAVECLRHFHEKACSFLAVENVDLGNEEWGRTSLKSAICNNAPSSAKLNALLAFGALIGGQRHWANIFFDKWRRQLVELFDSSDYEVAEGLMVMSYYSFFLGDTKRALRFAESAAEICIRARPGGGLVFIRARALAELIMTPNAQRSLAEAEAGLQQRLQQQELFLKRPLLAFPEECDARTKLTLSCLLEQLILASSQIHMWRACQQIAECRGRTERGRRRQRRKSAAISDDSSCIKSSSSSSASGGKKSRQGSAPCQSGSLRSPLQLLSLLQSLEDELEALAQRLPQPDSSRSNDNADGNKKEDEEEDAERFMDDLLAFARFVLCCVRIDCHREAGMVKNAYTSVERLLSLLERDGRRTLKFVAALSPLILSFMSPVVELLGAPLRNQFMSVASNRRALALLQPLREVLPAILSLPPTFATIATLAAVTVASSTTSLSSTAAAAAAAAALPTIAFSAATSSAST